MPSAPTPELVGQIFDLGLATILIVGGFREWYVWGPAHRRQLAEKSDDAKFWRDAYLKAIAVARATTEALSEPETDDA